MSVYGVLMATGCHSRPGRTPYVWRDRAASTRRQALAAAILAEVGEEPDAWDSPEDRSHRDVGGWLLKGCGTIAAYQRHRRCGERPCAECTDANRRYIALRKAARIAEGTWRRAS